MKPFWLICVIGLLSNSVTSIDDFAFEFCVSLASITIPNNVTSIGLAAFGQCVSLTGISIPSRVTIIRDMAFIGCSSLTSITVDVSNNHYEIVNGELHAKDGMVIWKP